MSVSWRSVTIVAVKFSSCEVICVLGVPFAVIFPAPIHQTIASQRNQLRYEPAPGVYTKFSFADLSSSASIIRCVLQAPTPRILSPPTATFAPGQPLFCGQCLQLGPAVLRDNCSCWWRKRGSSSGCEVSSVVKLCPQHNSGTPLAPFTTGAFTPPKA